MLLWAVTSSRPILYQKSVCFSKMPRQESQILCIPTSFSSTLNTKYLELCNFSSKWVQLKKLSILMQFLYFDQSIYIDGNTMANRTSDRSVSEPSQLSIPILKHTPCLHHVSHG